jgi:hypothetical protein
VEIIKLGLEHGYFETPSRKGPLSGLRERQRHKCNPEGKAKKSDLANVFWIGIESQRVAAGEKKPDKNHRANDWRKTGRNTDESKDFDAEGIKNASLVSSAPFDSLKLFYV